ncbi:MAG: cupin domain-containing protein [archaeon]|nr:cupin domain-containing protein [archaeon]
MIIKRVSDYEPFKAVDGSEIVEVIGMPTTNTKEVSLASAKIKPRSKTVDHYHDFTEIYMVIEGEGIMCINDEVKDVKEGDNILIPSRSWHCIENKGDRDLRIWCICAPAFTEEGTVLK